MPILEVTPVFPFRKMVFIHIAAFSLVLKDVPTYMTVTGTPPAVGLNLEGMKRRNYDSKTRAAIKET